MSEQPGQYGPPAEQPGQPGYGAMPPPPPGGGYGMAPYSAQAPGAVGQVRGVGISILLAIVTLGIYTFVWTWKTHEEVKRNSGQGVGGPLGFVIYFVVAPVTLFLLPNEIKQMLERAGRPSRVQALTGLWFLLPIVGDIVWFVKVQGQLNEYWRSLGAPG